ncbi:MAG: TAXI family TRAP transporter solute-binding subunit [Brevibacterium sp.]|uniref:TAXI family TRAP transporter solute-binding subunit n=1 Tax=Brevibacterium sp. TaxID=1701 RepID=UPI00264A269A|nr:TAXI family TRAP transporter solute-binding subunit [Brevibacterium sp.]MDN5806635.1 TAXI family TRAP transporter solute-binding subunit [Brevibacterium sp.]MDN5833637.1 TAXI family TRAP transporter solute-binding subunit [Brevibacterium sp.]MDN5875246.1 TAXI family TRAP transporter solute-binding subunit [Brevibacterium sp.]MDN5909191.1 TAXI family TRAP transporter solute-binding subunit [Brevibacterium sp.]MDN6133817.1 TAXI family TRAP transporter solute-binding subunit [Brevibacterium sp
MNIRRMTVAAIAALALSLSACGSGSGGGGEGETTDDLTLGTGGTSGTYYPLGGELASIFEENVDGVTVNYVESGASAENLGKIYQGEWQLGFTQSDTANNAVKGELEDLDGTKIDNVGWIASMYPEAAHIIVREDSGIESVKDLKGKKVAVGDAGSGTRAISDAVLNAADISESDYTPEITDFGASTDMLADKQIDATIFVVGTPVAGLTQLAATTDVKLLGLEEETTSAIEENTGAESYDIPADAYDFLDEDVSTVSVFASLVASTDQVSEDTAYGLTKAMFEHTDEVTLDVGKLITKDTAMLGIGDVPLHPGAKKYYDEEGIDLP